MLLLLSLLLLTPVRGYSVDSQPCQSPSEERWREVAALLEVAVEVKRETLCEQRGVEGNYTGQVVGGVREGWGEMRWQNGTLYGPGNIFYYSAGDRYFGQWRAGRQDGLGTLLSQTGLYVGEWEEGVQSGRGTAVYNNGNNYTGQFRAGQKHGSGVFRASNGDVYTGQFKAGVREGEGIETFYNGEKYVGQYQGDVRQGLGSAYYRTGQLKYVGEWWAGSPHGNGTYLALNGDRYQGGFTRGVITGPGTVSETNGRVRRVGQSEGIQFRDNNHNKYSQLVSTISTYLGLDSFFEKYRTFYNNFIWPNLPG